VRATIERIRNFPPLSRDGFALGVAQSLDALGEAPGTPRLVPLAREAQEELFRLTLSTSGDPVYRVFDVVRTSLGEAIVRGRRTLEASSGQRVRAIRCRCGGRLYEHDKRCRGCGTGVGDLGNVKVEGTFVLGAAGDVAGLCGCGGPLGSEDRFCGQCGRSLEEI
jgi:hypothetical protein